MVNTTALRDVIAHKNMKMFSNDFSLLCKVCRLATIQYINLNIINYQNKQKPTSVDC